MQELGQKEKSQCQGGVFELEVAIGDQAVADIERVLVVREELFLQGEKRIWEKKTKSQNKKKQKNSLKNKKNLEIKNNYAKNEKNIKSC